MAAGPSEKIDLLIYGPSKPLVNDGFSDRFVLHKVEQAADLERLAPAFALRIRGVAVTGLVPANGASLARFPKLEIISSFGVGYDHIDVAYARDHGIVVTNTPDVLTEEVADTALGLLIATLREFIQADRYVRSGPVADARIFRSAPARCATARSASSAWAGSVRRSRAGSRRRGCRWCIIRAARRGAWPTSTIRT